MSWITPFFEQNFIVVYFFYGLAFFGMGMAILLEARRSSAFYLAEAVLALALFGIIHGLNEWFEMFQLLDQAGATNIPAWLLWEPIRLLHLVTSFALLVFFGVQLIFAHREAGQKSWRIAAVVSASLTFMWFVTWLLTVALLDGNANDLADVLSRYMLAIPGAFLAGWALILERRSFRARGIPQFGSALLIAAIAIVLYGVIGQIFTRPSVLFPSNIINSVWFFESFGVPVQLFRACAAVLMAFAFTRALRVFDVESARELANARAESLAAQRETQEATEALNIELQHLVSNLQSLNELSRQLSATLDRTVILQEVFLSFVHDEPRIGAGMIMLKLRRDDSAEIVVKTTCPAPDHIRVEMEAVAFELGQQASQSGQPAYWDTHAIHPLPESLRSAESDPWQQPQPELHIIGVPLKMHNTIAGCLVACTAPGMAPFSREDYALISTAARQFSTALQNAVLYEQAQHREALRGEMLRQIVAAQENERQRIARELHDGPGQTLTGLGLGLAAVAARLQTNPAIAAQQLAELRELNATTLQELRDIIVDLRPSLLDDLGLVAALRSQVQQTEQRTDASIELVINGHRRRLEPQLETIVFRIVQEALSNIIKHAQANNVIVQLTYSDAALDVAIEDDGCGFDVTSKLEPVTQRRNGWGLLGIRERVALATGSCTIESQSGAGTRIDVHLPLAESGVNYVEN